jgi:hypothetical protein
MSLESSAAGEQRPVTEGARKKYIVTNFGAEQEDGRYQYRNSIMAFDSPQVAQVYGRSGMNSR